MKTARFLFNDAMARAIVEGRKTVTRRPVKWQKAEPVGSGPGPLSGTSWPCAPGDLLIGRECWAAIRDESEEWNESTPHGGRVEYRADHDPPLRKPGGWDDAEPGHPEMVHWRPSIHMPDWAARIRRRVVSVTVERLQDVTIQDAVREGFPEGRHGGTDARNDFLCAWDDIYLNRGLASLANPWVWRIKFSAENMEAPNAR